MIAVNYSRILVHGFYRRQILYFESASKDGIRHNDILLLCNLISNVLNIRSRFHKRTNSTHRGQHCLHTATYLSMLIFV